MNWSILSGLVAAARTPLQVAALTYIGAGGLAGIAVVSVVMLTPAGEVVQKAIEEPARELVQMIVPVFPPLYAIVVPPQATLPDSAPQRISLVPSQSQQPAALDIVDEVAAETPIVETTPTLVPRLTSVGPLVQPSQAGAAPVAVPAIQPALVVDGALPVSFPAGATLNPAVVLPAVTVLGAPATTAASGPTAGGSTGATAAPRFGAATTSIDALQAAAMTPVLPLATRQQPKRVSAETVAAPAEATQVPAPTNAPTAEPTRIPPVVVPTRVVIVVVTQAPAPVATQVPAPEATQVPPAATQVPAPVATHVPTTVPNPTTRPTQVVNPTQPPNRTPTPVKTPQPTTRPTQAPTVAPTAKPTSDADDKARKEAAELAAKLRQQAQDAADKARKEAQEKADRARQQLTALRPSLRPPSP